MYLKTECVVLFDELFLIHTCTVIEHLTEDDHEHVHPRHVSL